jgi:hypothetical protein
MKLQPSHMRDSDTMLVILISTLIGGAIGQIFFGDIQYAAALGGLIGFFVGVCAKLGLFDLIENIVGIFD